ncbi:MAG: glycine betaine ABC transporter substrate-binding protein [Gemmatimonadota bacterium]
MRRFWTLLLFPMAFAQADHAVPRGARAIVVASKPFGESYILEEMFAQLLEARGYRVIRRPGLAATDIAFRALQSGAIDVYPEYTGTGLLAILKDTTRGDAGQTFTRIATEFERRWGIRWLPPLGFENTYAMAVRRETAEHFHLQTLSDLARASDQLTAGFTPDFIGRPDGLPGLTRAYGLRLKRVHSLGPAIKYQALVAGTVDVIDGYSTDGLIARYDLVILRDDLHFFPPYEAAALVGSSMVRDAPGAMLALTELSGRLSVERMRRLNQRVEAGGEPVARVADEALREIGVLDQTRSKGEPALAGRGSTLSYLVAERGNIFHLTLRHLLLVGVSLAGAIAIALPLGLVLERNRGGAEAVIRSIGILQTVPSIALLAFMIPLLGVGVMPALTALLLYSLYPILRNTYSGVRDADPNAVEGARASGMTERQILRYVRLPLAAPIIMAGIRTSAVINVGTATLAAFIGAGGLGDPIVAGLALSDARMVLSGAIPAALLALAVDGLLGLGEAAVRPGGV